MEWKFEYIFAFVITIILGLALAGAFWINNSEMANMILIAFVGGLSSITAYFFTKHKPDKKENEQ